MGRPGRASMSAIRAHVAAAGADGGLWDGGVCEAVRARAHELGVLGWVRDAGDGAVALHAEGTADALDALVAFLHEPRRGAAAELTLEQARVEGHEQFAIRGVSAGAFVVQEHSASTHHFDLRLEVDGTMR